MNKRELILMLRNGDMPKKFTYEKIGALLGVSRQRVHFIATNKKWTGKSGRPRKAIIGNAEL